MFHNPLEELRSIQEKEREYAMNSVRVVKQNKRLKMTPLKTKQENKKKGNDTAHCSRDQSMHNRRVHLTKNFPEWEGRSGTDR